MQCVVVDLRAFLFARPTNKAGCPGRIGERFELKMLFPNVSGHRQMHKDNFSSNRIWPGHPALRYFARRVLEEQGRYAPNEVGPGSLFSKIKKYSDTHFTD
jgi:hypothetical protein